MTSYVLIIMCVHLVSITRGEDITITIEDLDELITSSLDRVLGEIDPTIAKFRNTTIEILSVIEDRIHINVSEVLYWLQTNLFVNLVGIIVGFLFLLLVLNLLDILLLKYGYSIGIRRFVGLSLLTFICIWLLVAIILSVWLPPEQFSFQTLKYVFIGLLSFVVLCLSIVWFTCVCIYLKEELKQHDKRGNVIVKGKKRTAVEDREMVSIVKL